MPIIQLTKLQIDALYSLVVDRCKHHQQHCQSADEFGWEENDQIVTLNELKTIMQDGWKMEPPDLLKQFYIDAMEISALKKQTRHMFVEGVLDALYHADVSIDKATVVLFKLKIEKEEIRCATEQKLRDTIIN